MDKEYEALRQEILQWQSRRFTVVGGSIVIVTAILGWVTMAPEKWSWAIASVLPLTFLVSVCYLTWLFIRFNIRIGTYLQVFHESAWERRKRAFLRDIKKFRRGIKTFRLSWGLALLYGGLGVVSIVIPHTVCLKPSTKPEIILFTAVAFLFVFMLVVLAFFPHPTQLYISQWQKMKDQEAGGQARRIS
ncbi:hypothetical protein ES702_04265 [subsurface metagenome]